ncbi:ATP-binding protein [bacterium]|nr:ATP-binding protein [bacterium]
MDLKSIKLTIKSRLENVSLVGQTVNKICSVLLFTENAAYQTELCVVEACNNVIEHAYLGDPDKDLDVIVRLYPDKITFDICDSGNPMPSSYCREMDFDPTDRSKLPEGGMGLFFIHEIMNQVEYRTQGVHNVLSLTKFCSSLPENSQVVE